MHVCTCRVSAPSCLSQSSGSKGTWTCRRGVSGRIFEGTEPHPPGQAEGGHDRGAVEQRGEQERRHDVETVHLAAWGRLGLTEEGILGPVLTSSLATRAVWQPTACSCALSPAPGRHTCVIFTEYNVPRMTTVM